MEQSFLAQVPCVYCGDWADTKDHTPPRCFLQPPLPSNLITLPACKKCNSTFSFDENVVSTFMGIISARPELNSEQELRKKSERAFERDSRLKTIIGDCRQPNGNFVLTGGLLGCMERVLVKTVQGLYYALYGRVVEKNRLFLKSVEDLRTTTRENVVDRVRPPALRDITDMPLPELTPSCWMAREPVIIMKFKPDSSEDGEPVQRIFRLVRDTPVEWIPYQPEVFEFEFVQSEDGKAVCILDLRKTLIATVDSPWPDKRGHLRRGRKNPFSRERRDSR
jgi:hypothetical protein